MSIDTQLVSNKSCCKVVAKLLQHYFRSISAFVGAKIDIFFSDAIILSDSVLDLDTAKNEDVIQISDTFSNFLLFL